VLLFFLALLYTPHNEHFGIVPIESMYLECPVIAVNAGGPMETVVDECTGFLCEQSAVSFAEAMHKFVVSGEVLKKDFQSLQMSLRERMGKAGKLHVKVSQCFAMS
jgi:alpha-1,3/alpha-1,6-mannosyltransferase